MLNRLLKKLIHTSAGRTRFVLAIVGLSAAMFLILSAVQIQADYNELLYSKANQDSVANFLLVNKQVTDRNLANLSLSAEEIEDLKKQPFIQSIGQLAPSRFKVSAESVSQHLPFYTDLFFESVPDEFIDVNNKDWQWNEHSQFIPLIIPNTFLDMYNFGFAATQNLPQLTQELVKSLTLKINIYTSSGIISYYAKVVGFSDRISSILVPQSFMDWANNKYGEEGMHKTASRVVIKTKDAGNPELVKYLQDHDLTTDADKTRFSKYRQVVDMVVYISSATGAIMLLFALLIFTLFIQLTIASCKDEILLLITLGAAPKQLFRFLMKQFYPINIVIAVVVLIIVGVLQFLLQKYLQGQHMHVSPYISLFTVGVALLILLVMWLVNRFTIQKYIRKTNNSI